MMPSMATVLDTSLVDFAAVADPLCMRSALPFGSRLVPVAFLVMPKSTTVAYASSLLLASRGHQPITLWAMKYRHLPRYLPWHRPQCGKGKLGSGSAIPHRDAVRGKETLCAFTSSLAGDVIAGGPRLSDPVGRLPPCYRMQTIMSPACLLHWLILRRSSNIEAQLPSEFGCPALLTVLCRRLQLLHHVMSRSEVQPCREPSQRPTNSLLSVSLSLAQACPRSYAFAALTVQNAELSHVRGKRGQWTLVPHSARLASPCLSVPQSQAQAQ
mmetsp:Transcript_96535/g.166398  ORF Transcript_96535/g.166398 Transcript_96535/m.166398 type:complete len:270 (+) Transcript_96535:822-1631(+)